MPIKLNEEGEVVEDEGFNSIIPPKRGFRKKIEGYACGGGKTRAGVSWSEEEIGFLKAYWWKLGPVLISVELNRELEDVEGVARKIGLKDPEHLIKMQMKKLNKVWE